MSEWPQENSQSITLNTGAWEKQLKDARLARELERAAIVAWLRSFAEWDPDIILIIANEIEAGDHLRADDE